MGKILDKIKEKAINYDISRATNIVEQNFKNANKTQILANAMSGNLEPLTKFGTTTAKEVGSDFMSTNKKLIVIPVLTIASVGGVIGFAIGKYLKKSKRGKK